MLLMLKAAMPAEGMTSRQVNDNACIVQMERERQAGSAS